MAEKTKTDTNYAVYTNEAGSYTVDGVVFTPGAAVPVTQETINKLCAKTSPVKVFDTKEAAEAFLAELKAEFARKPRG